MLYPFFELSSVALSYGANSINNPAGLGYGGGEFLAYYGDSSFAFNLKYSSLGLGYEQTIDAKKYLNLASASEIGPLSVGGDYDFLRGRWRVGLLLRPYNFLSFGAVYTSDKGYKSTSLGLGIRPFRDYLTAYVGTYYTKLDLNGGTDLKKFVGLKPSFGVFLQPLSHLGLRFEAVTDSTLKNYTFSGGFEISYSNLRFGSALSSAQKTFGLLVSKLPFTPSLKKGRYEVKLRPYTEDGREGFLSSGKKFYNFISSLKEAAESPQVEVIAVDMREGSLSMAQAEEVRKVLQEAKKRGKKILFYSDYYSTGSYYLASVGEVYMAPAGEMYLPGLSAELTFFKRALDSLGIKAQEFRMGKYKSAVESFVRDTMSEANREQMRRLLEVFWDIWLEDVAKSRGLDPDSLNSLIKSHMGAFLARDAKELSLVDSLIYEDQWRSILRKAGRKVKLVKVQRREWKTEKPKVAVVVAEGSIVSGESSESPLPYPLGGKSIGDRTLVKILNELRKDKSVKAVVLRVNSPGGSALASDNIARAVKLLSKDKVIIVSMGSVAASGGYYISALADSILVDRTTITGSIGVIGLKLSLGDFYKKKLHLNRDVVKTYPFSDAFSLWREMDSSEVEVMMRSLEHFYDRFTSVVAEGRGLSQDSVKSIGGGRVWAGYDAVQIGLADRFGGLLDAIDLAAKLAKVKDYDVVVYPRPKAAFEKVKGMLKGSFLKSSPFNGGFDILYRMEYDVKVE